jgi:ribosome-binding protein aMBF1 (putative translation factor)
MPYKSERIKIEGTQYDRRVKLSPDKKEYVRWLREEEKLSYNQLAKMFGVSKRLIQFVCNPEIHQKAKERFKELRKDGRYYDREAHNESVKSMRKWKQELYLENKI